MKTLGNLRHIVIVTGLLLWIGLLTAPADAKTVNVNCPAKTIAAALTKATPGEPLVVNVSGACPENVVITIDDVTLQGIAAAAVNAADPAQAAISIDGGRRIVIDNLTVSGGTDGVVGRRGASFDLTRCLIENNTRFGVLASYGVTGTIDQCTVENVVGSGVVAANGASLVITNSTIQNNSGKGVVAVRNAFVRIGQNLKGEPVVNPVTIQGNGENGVVIAQSSAGILVGGSVQGNGAMGIYSAVFVGRGSSGLIGADDFGLVAGTSVQNNTGNGVSIEGGNATILDSTISGNGRHGVSVSNGGSTRIGILHDSSAYAGNLITANARHGVSIVTGGSALLGGNTIQANGTDASVPFRFGVFLSQATATLVGGNTISNHPNTGVFVGSGAVAQIGNPGFGLPISNIISGNGGTGDPGAWGGIFAFQGGVIQTRGATITANVGAGAAAFENGLVELREGTMVDANVFGFAGFNGGHGVIAGFRSVVRLRDAGTTVVGNDGDGVQLFSGSAVGIRDAVVSVTGNTGFGLRCFAETNYRGNVTGVTGNPGGGNDDGFNNIPGCNRF